VFIGVVRTSAETSLHDDIANISFVVIVETDLALRGFVSCLFLAISTLWLNCSFIVMEAFLLFLFLLHCYHRVTGICRAD